MAASISPASSRSSGGMNGSPSARYSAGSSASGERSARPDAGRARRARARAARASCDSLATCASEPVACTQAAAKSPSVTARTWTGSRPPARHGRSTLTLVVRHRRRQPAGMGERGRGVARCHDQFEPCHGLDAPAHRARQLGARSIAGDCRR